MVEKQEDVSLHRGDEITVTINITGDPGKVTEVAQRLSQVPLEPIADRKGLARFLNVSESTVDRMVREGLPHFRVGMGDTAKVRFDVSEVLGWLKKRARERNESIRNPRRKHK